MNLDEIALEARIGVMVGLARSGRVVERPGPALSQHPFSDRQPLEVGRYIYLFDVGAALMYRAVIPDTPPPSSSWSLIPMPLAFREVAPIDSALGRAWYGQYNPVVEVAERLGDGVEQARGDLEWFGREYEQSPIGHLVGIITGVDQAFLDAANDLVGLPAALAALPQALHDLKEQFSIIAPELMREAREHPVDFALELHRLVPQFAVDTAANLLGIPEIVQFIQRGITEAGNGNNRLATESFMRAVIKILGLILIIRELVAAIRRAPQHIQRVTARLEEIGNRMRAFRGRVQSGEVVGALERNVPPTRQGTHHAPGEGAPAGQHQVSPSTGNPATQQQSSPPPAPTTTTGVQSIRARVRQLQNRLRQRLRTAYARQQVEQLLTRIPPPRISELLEKARRHLPNFRSANARTRTAAISNVKGPLFEMAVTTMPWHQLYRRRARTVLRRINQAVRLFDEGSIRFINGIRTANGQEFTDGMWVAFSPDRRRMLVLDVYESKSAQNWRDLIGQLQRDRERLTQTNALRIPSERIDSTTRGVHRTVAQSQSIEIDRANVALASDYGQRLNWTAIIPRHLYRDQSVVTAMRRLQGRGHPGSSVRDTLEERLREFEANVIVRENPLENDVAEAIVDELFHMAGESIEATASGSNP